MILFLISFIIKIKKILAIIIYLKDFLHKTFFYGY